MRLTMTSPADGLTIGELSKMTGVHIETTLPWICSWSRLSAMMPRRRDK